MLQKTRIACMIANVWTCINRLVAIKGIKTWPIATYKKTLENLKTGDEKELRTIERNLLTLFKNMMYSPAVTKDGKAVPQLGLLTKMSEQLGFQLQISGKDVSAAHFKLILENTKTLEDYVAALRAPDQPEEILDCLSVAQLTPVLKDGIVVSYPTPYSGMEWCGNAEELLNGLEAAAAKAKMLNSIFKWIRENLDQEELVAVGLQHSYVVLSKINTEGGELVSAKHQMVETPNGARQRELRIKLEEALRIRTKKVQALVEGPKRIEYVLEGEEKPLTIDLEVVTGW